jgi:UDP-N-acetyl-2-amino-2-deoxyglucuronate dehydrogenase
MIGCGGIAQVHLQSYKQIKQKEPAKFEFTAMCDPVTASAKQFADQAAALQDHKPKVYTSVLEMLAKEELDAVDICTPHSEHHIAGIACLDAGVNVMIEKPLGITVKASKTIIAAGKKNKKIVATAENIRRGISQRTSHWIINELKLLGTPRLLFSQQAGWFDPSTERRWHWRVDKWMGGGGMVMDSGAHFCDTIRFLYGDPETVYAKVQQLEKWPHKKEDKSVMDDREDTWAATVTFKNGLVAVWSWTMAAPGYSYTNVVHYGSKGCILDHGDAFHGPFSSAEIILQEGPKKITTPMVEMQKQYLAQLGEAKKNALFPHGFMDGFVIECYDFLDAVEKKRKPEVDGDAGLKAKAICEAIFESAYVGQAVKYDEVVSGKTEEYQKPINEHWGL